MTREPLVFVKSRFSLNGDCVQWAFTPGSVFVSDSKDPEGLLLSASIEEWQDFTGSTAAGVPVDTGLTWRHERGGVSVFHAAAPTARLWFTTSEWTAFVSASRNGEAQALVATRA